MIDQADKGAAPERVMSDGRLGVEERRPIGRRRRASWFWDSSIPTVCLLFAVLNIAVAKWKPRTYDEFRESGLLAALAPGKVPRFDYSCGEGLDRYLSYIPDATKAPLSYVVGMSQMYTINDPQPSDSTIVEHIDDALAPDARAFGLAAPSLDNEEALMLLLAVAGDARTKPANFVFGACFDKMREVDIRPGYLRFISKQESLKATLRQTAQDYAARYPLAAAKMVRSLGEVPSVAEDTTLEARARLYTGKLLPVVEDRSRLDWTLQMDLFSARNAVLGIKPEDKRPMIRSRYELNLQFLEMLADVAAQDGIRLVIYLNPLNPMAQTPYVQSEYEAYKDFVERFAADRGIHFANLENIVPAGDWGEWAGGADFMHFREEGHRITARAILDRFGPLLRQRKGP